MSGYSVVVFVHVLSAIVLVGASLFGPLLALAVRRAASVESLREWARYVLAISRSAGPAAPVTLLTGLYLGFAGGWWGDGWIEVSLVLFVLAAAGAIGVLDPYAKRLVEASGTAPDGPVPVDLDRLRRARTATMVEPMLLASDVAILFLMITKPGLVVALGSVAVTWTVGALWAAREVRHDEEASATAAAA